MERPNKIEYEISTDIGTAVATHEYINDLEKYIDYLENKNKEEYCQCLIPMTDSRDTFSRCNQCKRKVNHI